MIFLAYIRKKTESKMGLFVKLVVLGCSKKIFFGGEFLKKILNYIILQADDLGEDGP